MKKTFLTILAMLMVSSSAFAFPFFKRNVSTELQTVPTFAAESQAENKVWVGTFELVWNVLMDEIVNGPVNFVGGNPELADELNKQAFKADMISENSYYTAHGTMTPELKNIIDTALKEKFNETSDLLKNMDWNSGKYLVYAMLKKDFEFINAFDELKKEKFGSNKTKVQYFGIDKNSKAPLRDNVSVLFYNSDKDFAVKLYTKGNDKIILYRTDDNKSFDRLYNDVLAKSEDYKGEKMFTKKDKFKVPNLKFKTNHEYSELAGKTIENTDFTIDAALQSIDFSMNNKGVELKSEAALIMKMSMPLPVVEDPRNFYFDDTFVLFLIEKDNPYFALRVKDAASLNLNNK